MPNNIPILDNIQAKTTEVIVETSENIYDSVQAMIREGQSPCERRWSASKVLLGYFDLPMLDHIAQAPSPKILLEQVERDFDEAKEKIQ